METGGQTQVLLGMKIRPAGEVLVTRLGDETMMLDLASLRYFGLDPMGTAVWEALTAAPSAAAAVDALLEQYDVDRETLARDVSNLIAQMAEKGLLDVSIAAAA